MMYMFVAKEEWCNNCQSSHPTYLEGCVRPNRLRAYKLVRLMKDGTLSSLFINKKERLPLNTWLKAAANKTKGFAFRPGWHCTLFPKAPHLSKKGRVWVEVELEDFEVVNRPESQGGIWLLANKMKINKVL